MLAMHKEAGALASQRRRTSFSNDVGRGELHTVQDFDKNGQLSPAHQRKKSSRGGAKVAPAQGEDTRSGLNNARSTQALVGMCGHRSDSRQPEVLATSAPVLPPLARQSSVEFEESPEEDATAPKATRTTWSDKPSRLSRTARSHARHPSLAAVAELHPSSAPAPSSAVRAWRHRAAQHPQWERPSH